MSPRDDRQGRAARLLAAGGALLAPPGCVACRAPTAAAGERLCAACVRALPWLRPGCPRCGLPSHRGRGCPAAAAAFPRAWAPLAHEGVARDLVAALKFRSALPVADLMAAQMAANLPPPLRAGSAALVPVPGQRARRRRRGFDPAGEIADALGGGSGARSRRASSAATAVRASSAPGGPRGAPGAHRRGGPRATAAHRAARRRRPYDRRHARRLRPRAAARRRDRRGRPQLHPDVVSARGAQAIARPASSAHSSAAR